ncbi:hypothetical protein B0T24DRAFT_587633 [Lasiosphaeria ovina]|uniref:Uncharacterized protein n=1 Tax=Lasiosphaeria ovina TaxID=92902 RepID=A0AAE0TXC3_9PEZI|nr:hypothetical protein B0T24DRAFT_587633 [Lasiosphaeria ovina]
MAYPITSTDLKNSFEEFKRARRQLRDAQDDARAESFELRDQLKEYWKARKSETAPLPAVEGDGYEVIEQQPKEQPPYQHYAIRITRAKAWQNTTFRVFPLDHVPHRHPLWTLQATAARSVRPRPSLHSSRSHKILAYWQVDEIAGRHFHVHHKDGAVT